MPLPLADLSRSRAAAHPRAAAILGVGRPPLTYAELEGLTLRTGGVLRGRGITRADRVAIVLPNGPEMAVAFLGVAAVAAAAPLNPGYRAEEFAFYLEDLQARALVVEAGSRSPAVGVARDRGMILIEIERDAGGAGRFHIEEGGTAEAGFAGAGDVALLLHTSGTTSRPKMVPLTHRNLLSSARNIAEGLALSAADRTLNIMPLFHIHGLAASLLASLWAGGSVVCTPGFEAPAFIDWLAEFAPTWYTAVPTMHQSILRQAERRPQDAAAAGLRFIRSCSAPLAPRLMSELEAAFHAPVIEAYGMTEAAHQMTSNPLPPGERKPGSVGRAAGPEVAIMNGAGELLPPGAEGEVVIRGANVMTGYLNHAEANAAAFTGGWFRTGDQGVMDEAGYLRLTGRLKEMINRAGEKISPKEIDEVLLDHPDVAQAVTFAIPDPRLGEDVGAAVVLRPERRTTARAIQEFVSARLACFKVPSTIVFLDEIPKGPTGKQQRIGLAARLGIERRGAEPAAGGASFEEPRGGTELALAVIWAEVLRIARVGRTDDFLELGGDSVLAAQVISRVRDRWDVEFPLAAFFAETTLAGQAVAVQAMLAGAHGG